MRKWYIDLHQVRSLNASESIKSLESYLGFVHRNEGGDYLLWKWLRLCQYVLQSQEVDNGIYGVIRVQ